VTTASEQDTPATPAAKDTGAKGTRASRRGVLAGVGLAGIAGAVSACGLVGGSSAAGGAYGGNGNSGGGASTGGAGASPSAGGGAATGALASTSEIPVGGGKVFSSQQVVVTQPEKGTFKGFSAICTHMQCTVDQVANGTIDCPCHGSQFSVKDGSVVAGPAPKPLPAAAIKVTGTEIALG
jgi:nitrite reductase/ring-hydroxylating ferredoxin subunit